MIKLSDIKTTVEYDKPLPDYATVHAHLEVTSEATIRERDWAKKDRFIEDAKHLCIRKVFNHVHDMSELRALIADLEQVALMNPQANPHDTRELVAKIRVLLEGRE